MVETTKNLVEEVNKMKECCANTYAFGDILKMDEDEFVLVKTLFKIVDISTELMVKQAEMMEEQNKKIDELLKLAKRETC